MWEIIVHWLHTLCATFWFGGTLYVNAVVGPALRRSTPATMADAAANLGRQSARVTRPMALLTILLGIVLGTYLGPIKSWGDLLGSAYGKEFLAAFVLSIVVYLWGQVVSARAALRIAVAPEADRLHAVRRLSVVTGIELIGFLAILACMVLMHFAEEHHSAVSLVDALIAL